MRCRMMPLGILGDVATDDDGYVDLKNLAREFC